MSARGALDLLSVYEDDISEDEIVPGPKVSTKRAHKSDSEDEELSNNTKSRLPVPKLFMSTLSTPSEHEGNSTQHNGRIRGFAHERGNWATFVYIPTSRNPGIAELIEQIQNSFNGIQLSEADHFHISLTKTVVIKYHWIESFSSSIHEHIRNIKRFVVMFDSLQVYMNEDCTRTFIGLKIKTGYDSLMQLTQLLDKCLSEYKLETFYKDPCFHMSILWCCGDKKQELENKLDALNEIFNKVFHMHSLDHWYINVESIQCKTGNKQYNFLLNS